jgi:hypothetical protein
MPVLRIVRRSPTKLRLADVSEELYGAVSTSAQVDRYVLMTEERSARSRRAADRAPVVAAVG